MEINKLQNSAISAYKKISSSSSAAGKSGVKAPNTDKIEFDFGASIAAAKADVASSIEAEANTARIEELQKLYAGDNCPVAAEEVAGKIAE